MGNCIYVNKHQQHRHVYSYETRPQPCSQPCSQPPLQQSTDELLLADFVSEQSDYDAFVRFHTYPDDVIMKSDILCYRLEVSRERLLWTELQFLKVKREVRYLTADIALVHQMDTIEPCEHTFGINPLSILEEQLREQQQRLDMYRASVKFHRHEVEYNYTALLQFWDKEYATLCMRTKNITAEQPQQKIKATRKLRNR